jgi:hypothetical protein
MDQVPTWARAAMGVCVALALVGGALMWRGERDGWGAAAGLAVAAAGVAGAMARRRGQLAVLMLFAAAGALTWVRVFRAREVRGAGWEGTAGALAVSLLVGAALGTLVWWLRRRRRPGEPS